MIKVHLTDNRTIAHEVLGTRGAAKVMLKPAAAGTGVIAGGAVRSIMDVVGVHNVLAKVVGSKNQINVSKATLDGLSRLMTVKEVAKRRGKSIQDIF